MSDEFNGISKEDAAAWIKARRKELGYTQAQVRDAIGLPNENYMTLYETARHDMRKSKYFGQWLAFCRVSVEDARERLGVTTLITNASQDSSVFAMPPGAERPDGALLVRHLGLIQGAMNPQVLKKQIKTPRLVECPLAIARKYNTDDLFTLTLDGNSMACGDVQRQIPEGATVLLHKYPGRLEPRASSIVAAYIPEIEMGVLKVFKRKDGVVLESYHPQGARFPAQQYPRMIIQGVCLGFWVEFG